LSYLVKEIFYTLQGEGINAGRPAVFCRFAGCNLWSGREQDRASAQCKFCDTDFIGTDGSLGGKYRDAEALAEVVSGRWVSDYKKKFVVLTGGEPLLQVDKDLIDALHREQFEIAVETNGTVVAPDGIDWLCVSPKADTKWIQRTGNELKLVFPQMNLNPEDIHGVVFNHLLLQPMNNSEKNTMKAIAFCMKNPEWRISFQWQKIWGIR